MKNQVLSIEQMQKLKELGVDTSKASMAVYNIYAGEHKEYDILAANGAFAEKQEHDRFGYGIHNVVSFDKKPVFTLQDIVELLPAKIQRNAEYDLTIYKDFLLYSCEGKNNCVACRPLIFFNAVELFTDIEIGLIGAAYEMLIWVAENGYLKTK